MYKFLSGDITPAEIKKLKAEELKELAAEVRDRIILTTARKGGHLAASLGAVELAVALHYCLDSPRDKIIWDVGHQSYAHKILTGRNVRFDTLREMGGLSGFPNKNESEHDCFTSGHSSTAISWALGLARARDLNGEDHKVVAVVGDASLSTGLSFEGLNHAGHLGTSLIIVLNDNERAISRPIGAMSKYLNKVITNPFYNRVRTRAEKAIKGIPKLGSPVFNVVRKFQEGVKNLLVPAVIFEELGFRYFGPIDGHDINQLVSVFNNTFSLKGPILIHVLTKKGKGYKFAEEDPEALHGVTPFDIETGTAIDNGNVPEGFTSFFSRKVEELGKKDPKIVAITAAMKEGVGLGRFAEKFPDRFFDVGITEAHAVTFASGLARGGFKPVVAIYSTFLQRSYDQLIHDVALQELPVVLCIDRAGLVGKDGPTHHGVFDIVYLRSLPNFVVMAPKDGLELEEMLEMAVNLGKPAAIRYPKDSGERFAVLSSATSLEFGKAEKIKEGSRLAIIAVGSMVKTALDVSGILSSYGIDAAVVNARFIKPLDLGMVEEVSNSVKNIVVLEEGVVDGGFGSAVLEALERKNIGDIRIKCFGLPARFIEHGARMELLRKYHLTADEVALTIRKELF